MRTDDQWFEPGDKVMRVSDWISQSGLNIKQPEYGFVYCVDCFNDDPPVNLIRFVGEGGFIIANGSRYGWPAYAFRKVSEIQLCVRASKRQSSPSETQNA